MRGATGRYLLPAFPRVNSAEMKAARSPHFEAGGKRRRGSPGPKARNAAHPQERQHRAAAGGTRDRVRPARSSLNAAATPHDVRDRHPDGRRRAGIMAVVCRRRLRGSGRHAPKARPEGDAQKKFAVLNTVLILRLERWRDDKPLKSLARPERFERPTPRFVV
jgi:hypothetical protein